MEHVLPAFSLKLHKSDLTTVRTHKTKLENQLLIGQVLIIFFHFSW